MLNEHQNKTMDFIDRIGDFLQRQTPSTSAPSSKNDRLIDRHLDSLEGSVREIRVRCWDSRHWKERTD